MLSISRNNQFFKLNSAILVGILLVDPTTAFADNALLGELSSQDQQQIDPENLQAAALNSSQVERMNELYNSSPTAAQPTSNDPGASDGSPANNQTEGIQELKNQIETFESKIRGLGRELDERLGASEENRKKRLDELDAKRDAEISELRSEVEALPTPDSETADSQVEQYKAALNFIYAIYAIDSRAIWDEYFNSSSGDSEIMDEIARWQSYVDALKEDLEEMERESESSPNDSSAQDDQQNSGQVSPDTTIQTENPAPVTDTEAAQSEADQIAAQSESEQAAQEEDGDAAALANISQYVSNYASYSNPSEPNHDPSANNYTVYLNDNATLVFDSNGNFSYATPTDTERAAAEAAAQAAADAAMAASYNSPSPYTDPYNPTSSPNTDPYQNPPDPSTPPNNNPDSDDPNGQPDDIDPISHDPDVKDNTRLQRMGEITSEIQSLLIEKENLYKKGDALDAGLWMTYFVEEWRTDVAAKDANDAAITALQNDLAAANFSRDEILNSEAPDGAALQSAEANISSIQKQLNELSIKSFDIQEMIEYTEWVEYRNQAYDINKELDAIDAQIAELQREYERVDNGWVTA